MQRTPTCRLIRAPIRAPSFFRNIESNGSPSFRNAHRVHAVADAPKLFAEQQEGIEMATKSALTVRGGPNDLIVKLI